MPKILFLTVHRPDRSPSQRFRFEQYLEPLKSAGFDYDFSYLITTEDDKFFYKPGNVVKKGTVLIKSLFKRFTELHKVKQYDIVFVQRECIMLGTSFFEEAFANSKAKLIFDFDDSIWLQNVSEANKKLAFLKDPGKTARIIKVADMVFAGNEYLANYARKFNSKVEIIPTTINTEEYKPIPKTKKDKITIGWSGSITTIQHFEFAIPFLIKIKEKYPDKVDFKVIGDGNYVHKELGIQGLPWKKDTEVEELASIDIGLMPLPDDEWASGKCGLKGLQYMALEIATIMSPVGVNSEIIQHGKDGFLASTEEEWVNSLSLLIEDDELRINMGKEARKTIIKRYSVEALKERYIEIFQSLLK